MAPEGGLRCQSGKWQAACLEVPAGGLVAQGAAASRPYSRPGPSTWSQHGCPRSPRPGVTSRIQPCSQNMASSAEPCWARAVWGPGAMEQNWTALEAANSQPHALQGAATGPPDKCGSLSHQAASHSFLDSPIYFLLFAASSSSVDVPLSPLSPLSCSIILLEIGVQHTHEEGRG